jgi:hypothetical protein
MQLPASGCWHCRGRAAITVETVMGWAWPELWELAEEGMRKEAGPLAEALYGGRCRGCAEQWEPGDFIAYSEDEDSWLCADCAR